MKLPNYGFRNSSGSLANVHRDPSRPKDEYSAWLSTLKSGFSQPLGGLFLKWVNENKSKLMSKLATTIIDHPE
jgi:hypothetical protein